MSKVGLDDLVVAGASAEDLTALPRVDWWPTLAPEALYGLAGRIVETVGPYTEADPVAVLAHLLVGVGNVIGSGPHALVGAERHPLRFYAALVGQSSKARKGTAWGLPRYILGQVDETWRQARVKTGLSSGEGIIYHLRDARLEQQPVKDKGRVVGYETVTVDAGEPDKRLLVIESELATVLKRMAREGNSLSGVLRDAWDTGNLSTLTKNSPLRPTGAHLSIVGHITEPELHRYLTEMECANGFANRFLWLLVRRSKLLPDGPSVPDGKLAPLIDELREVVRYAGSLGELARDEAATASWRAVYATLTREEPGMVGGVIGRAEVQVLRLSILYAVLDGSTEVRTPHLLAALAVWEYAEASARRIFGDRLGDQVAEAILEALRVRGPQTLTGLHALFGRHRSAGELGAAVARLEGTGQARRVLKETEGRRAEVWEAIG